ncbi:MAG: hypothetical protein ACRC6E_05955 [Fusobacteriaceae bacterium]
MAKLINALACSDEMDMVFNDSGEIKVHSTNGASLADMLKLEFNQNDDWTLDKDLGIHWISENNDGILQTKNSEVALISAITRKLNSIDGIREIKEIEINRGLNRKIYIFVTVIADSGEAIKLGKEI